MTSLKKDLSDECVVGVYATAQKAETALHVLQGAGYTTEQISVVRQHFDPNGSTADELNVGDDSLHDAFIGGAVGGAVGAAGAATLITATGVGMILLSGPLVALTGVIVGAYLGAMKGWGIHEQGIKEYEQLVEDGKVLLIVSGDPPEVSRAETLLRQTDNEGVNLHARNSDDSPEVDDRPGK